MKNVTSVTVRCVDCGLQLVVHDPPHPDVTYTKNEHGDVLCPNDSAIMIPIGGATVMSAEEAFKVANRELVADESLPAGETTETLTQRLRDIEAARGIVLTAQERYETKRDAAKQAKKYLDSVTESFLAIVGRLSAVPATLPLFTPEAEENAEFRRQDDEEIAAARAPEAVYAALVDAGYLAASVEVIETWGSIQRDQARGWVAVGGTVDSMPRFMRDLMTDEETEAPAAQPAEATTR